MVSTKPIRGTRMLKIMKLSDIDRMLLFLKARSGSPRGLNGAYLWEVATANMMRVFYTESADFDNIFYAYYVKKGVVIEDWYTNGSSYIESILNLINLHPTGDIFFGFQDKRIGHTFARKLHDEIGEMKCLIANNEYLDSCPLFNPNHRKDVVNLLSQKWWTKDQSQDFVDVTSSNPSGLSKVVLDNTNCAIGFSHTMFVGDSAWINCVYVDEDCRGKGYARRLVESTIARLKEIGVANVFLGVDKSNRNAIKLYKTLGFEFTEFRKWQFQIDRALLKR